jgi:SynChlorMet cassette protein ScmC
MATAWKSPLLDKVSSIMRLGNGMGKNCPRLIMTGGADKRSMKPPFGRLDRAMYEGLPRKNWRGIDCESMRIWTHHEVEDVIYENFSDAGYTPELNQICLYLFPVYRKVIESGGMPVHAALVELNGMGVMLAAPGDTGKSTCCRRLPPPWNVLGDEEALIVRDHEGRYLAHPFPTWSDIYERKLKKSWDVQGSVPLSAVFFLEKSEKVRIAPIGRGQAVMQLNRLAREKAKRGCWCEDAEEVTRLNGRIFDNACELVQQVPSYILRTNLTGPFWEKTEEVLEWGGEATFSSGPGAGKNPRRTGNGKLT